MKQCFSVYRCKIKIIPLCIFIAVLLLLIRLGFWQLSRADEKREFLVNQQDKMNTVVLPIAELLAEKNDVRYRRVLLTGHYDVQHQFLIDNQFNKSQVGYFVLTPFILTSDRSAVLVNRGWVLMNKDRSKLPDIHFIPPKEQISIEGIINYFPQVGLALPGADVPGKGWPSVVQLVNTQKITNKLNLPILGFQVQLAKEQANGYVRDWVVHTRMLPEKHTAYAFQWFALAITLTLLTLWGSCKTKQND